MRDEEQIASQIMETAVPGSHLRYCEHQSNGEWDSDMSLPDGSVEPVEVTMSTDLRMERMFAAVFGKDGSKQWIPRVHAQLDWWITPTEDARIQPIRENADRYLAAVENENEERTAFYAGTERYASTAIAAIYTDLRIDAGQVVRWNPPGRIGIAMPGSGGQLSGDHVLAAAEYEANKSDNRLKLGRSRARERHLFILFERFSYLAQASIGHGEMPVQPPTLPCEITTLWIAAPTGEAGRYVVWRASSLGWARVGVVATDRPI